MTAFCAFNKNVKNGNFEKYLKICLKDLEEKLSEDRSWRLFIKNYHKLSIGRTARFQEIYDRKTFRTTSTP